MLFLKSDSFLSIQTICAIYLDFLKKKRKSRDNRQSREWQRRGGHVGDIPPIVLTSAVVVDKLHNLIAHLS